MHRFKEKKLALYYDTIYIFGTAILIFVSRI